MIISKSHKFIFCHAPKTGGETVRYLLKEYNISVQPPWATNWQGTIIKPHAALELISNILGRDIFENYFKFGCVRNPWALEVSRYFYIREPEQEHLRYDWAKNDFKTFINTFAKETETMNFNRFRINNAWALDYTIKVENFQEDLNNVCDKIGIPRQKLIHVNKSKHKHYTEYYDEETKQIVAEQYKRDIQELGYEFGE